MVVELSFVPCEPLLHARRRAAPGARFDRLSKRWRMNEGEYAAFWLEAVSQQRDRMITVHTVDEQPVTTP